MVAFLSEECNENRKETSEWYDILKRGEKVRGFNLDYLRLIYSVSGVEIYRKWFCGC